MIARVELPTSVQVAYSLLCAQAEEPGHEGDATAVALAASVLVGAALREPT